MSRCRGCDVDLRVPEGPGLVLMAIGYEDGGADDPWVVHRASERCPIPERPHRMTECGEFDPPATT